MIVWYLKEDQARIDQAIRLDLVQGDHVVKHVFAEGTGESPTNGVLLPVVPLLTLVDHSAIC